MTVAIVKISTADDDNTYNQYASLQASFRADSGFEWAKYRINQGVSPDLPETAFAGGSFTVSSEPNSGAVNATGRFDLARVGRAMTATFAKDCFQFVGEPVFDFSNDTYGTIADVAFQKSCTDSDVCGTPLTDCPDTMIITDMTLSWQVADQNSVQTEVVQIDGSDSSTGRTGVYYERRAGYLPQTGTPFGGAASGQEIDLVLANASPDESTDYYLTDENVHAFTTLGLSYPAGSGFANSERFTLAVVFMDGSSASRDLTWASIATAPDTTIPTETSGGTDSSDPVISGNTGGDTDGPSAEGFVDVAIVNPGSDTSTSFEGITPSSPVLGNNGGGMIDYDEMDPCILQMGQTGQPADCGDTNDNGVNDPSDGPDTGL